MPYPNLRKRINAWPYLRQLLSISFLIHIQLIGDAHKA